MFVKSKYVLFVFALMVALFSCKKEEQNSNSIDSLFELSVLSPNSNQIFRQQDTLIMRGIGRGPIEAHGYTVLLVNKQRSDTLFKRYKHTHGTELMIIEHVVLDSVFIPGNYSAHFILHIDHAGNQIHENRPLRIVNETL